MRIVVCVKQRADGDLNPFDACAYEAALRISGSEVILLSMAPEKSKSMLLSLTRLGAKEAYLLCDKAFAGADTLATSYALSKALEKLSPQLVFCGRQTVDGDTGQVGPGLSEFMQMSLITNVMSIKSADENEICCVDRSGEEKTAQYPALITLERINDLRLPSIRSKVGNVTVWSASDIDADISRCGLKGSPTQVLRSFESNTDKRKCTFVSADDIPALIEKGIADGKKRMEKPLQSGEKLKNLWIIGDKPYEYAKSVSDDVRVIEKNDPKILADMIRREQPSAVLWDSSPWSKQAAARVAVMLNTGLCADCTSLETDGEKLFMYRPAFSGNIIAKIVCKTLPQMATVRTGEDNTSDVMISIGKGARGAIDEIKSFAEKIGAELVASRGAVDSEMADYPMQIGLTGRCVNPPVYIAVGVSGAVHHIVGMKSSGKVIAINSDKNAAIFDYADYGVVGDAKEIFDKLKGD